MQKKTAVIVTMVICFIAFSALMSIVQAAPTATSGGVWITDMSDTPTYNFVTGQTAKIHWVADGTVDITVKDAANTVVYSATDQPTSASPLTYTPTYGGTYTVHVTGAATVEISFWTLFVVPESALGTIMATGAGFAAFGAFGVFKIKHAKNKKPL